MARSAAALAAGLSLLALGSSRAAAQADPSLASARGAERRDAGRFTIVAFPSDRQLAESLLAAAQASDSFPDLPRPTRHVLIAIAPDARRFRAWVGPTAPDWGAAVAIPSLDRVVMQGRWAGGGGGDPLVVLRHELAHLALAERLGDLPPRWFDEGYASYAAGEWGRDELLTANLALLLHRMPTLDSLDARFAHGSAEAGGAYALAHRAVVELAALDKARGLSLFFDYWRESGRMEIAVRRAYGITLEAFEQRWRSRTRRRYGVLALIGEMSMGAGFALLVILPLYILRRRRDRQRWHELRLADARAAAAAAAAEAAARADSADDCEGLPVGQSADGSDGPAEGATGPAECSTGNC